MTHSYARHDVFMCVTRTIICAPWLIHMLWHDSFIREPNLCVCHDSFICAPWRIHMCYMPHSYVRQDVFICCDMTHSYVWHDCGLRDLEMQCTAHFLAHGTHMNESWHTCEWVTAHIWGSHNTGNTSSCVPWLIHMCAMTHPYVCRDSFMCAMTHPYVCHDVAHCLYVCQTHMQWGIQWHDSIPRVWRDSFDVCGCDAFDVCDCDAFDVFDFDSFDVCDCDWFDVCDCDAFDVIDTHTIRNFIMPFFVRARHT